MPPRANGFTLLETLAVVGVIAIIAGVLVPVLAESKAEAKRTATLSNLRQVAGGAALYDDAYGNFDFAPPRLVASKIIPESLMATSFDPFPEGIANWNRRFFRDHNTLPATSYKDSVEPAIERMGPEVFREVQESSGGGWAVVFVGRTDYRYRHDGSEASTYMQTRFGRYFRLTFGGAVLKRSPRIRENSGSATVLTIPLFTDDATLVDKYENRE